MDAPLQQREPPLASALKVGRGIRAAGVRTEGFDSQLLQPELQGSAAGKSGLTPPVSLRLAGYRATVAGLSVTRAPPLLSGSQPHDHNALPPTTCVPSTESPPFPRELWPSDCTSFLRVAMAWL
eukprot:3937429-Rhodomonas_salina.3